MSAAGFALMLGGAGIMLAAGPAQAADISYKTECIPPAISGLPPVEGTLPRSPADPAALAGLAAAHGLESSLRRLGAALGWPEDAVG